MTKLYVGIDVGGTKVAYGLFDENYRILSRTQLPSRPDLPVEEAMSEIVGGVDILMAQSEYRRDELTAVGVCLPSFIDHKTGSITYTSNLPNWVGVPARDMLSERLNVPLMLDNDANAAAIAEHRMGAGKDAEHMIYITISTGIGGGLIINRRIFRGSHGMAGEIGHVLLSDSIGFPCACGNPGCAESISSGPNMARYAAHRIQEGAKSSIARYAGDEPITTVHVGKALAENDQLAIETVDRAAEYLARLFLSLYQTLDINLVVYGGGAVKVGPRLMEQSSARFNVLCRYASEYPVTFRPAQLGDDTGIIGAALLTSMADE